MRRRLTAIAAVLLSAILLTSCGDPGTFSDSENLTAAIKRSTDPALTYHYADGAQDPPTSYTAYAAGICEFSLSLFRARCKTEPGDFVFSPASAALQLSMLANAASADARQEILLALTGTLALDDCNICSSYFKSRLENVSKTGQKEAPAEHVTLAGAMLIDDGTDVKSAFLQTTANFYGYDVFRYDFKGDHADDKLAAYLAPYTDDSGISVGDNGSLNTVSAVSIADTWLEETAAAGTAAFNGEQSTPYFTSRVKLLQNGGVTGVLKYTEKNPLRLLLLMPEEGASLDTFIDSLNAAALRDLLGSMDVTKQTVAAIPAFSVETDKKAVSVSDSITKSGLYSLFTDRSDFSALNYTNTAKIGDMYEIPPSFSVSENGINAESALSAPASAPQKADITFDRPFIFMLLDNETDIPVLMGTCGTRG